MGEHERAYGGLVVGPLCVRAAHTAQARSAPPLCALTSLGKGLGKAGQADVALHAHPLPRGGGGVSCQRWYKLRHWITSGHAAGVRDQAGALQQPTANRSRPLQWQPLTQAMSRTGGSSAAGAPSPCSCALLPCAAVASAGKNSHASTRVPSDSNSCSVRTQPDGPILGWAGVRWWRGRGSGRRLPCGSSSAGRAPSGPAKRTSGEGARPSPTPH